MLRVLFNTWFYLDGEVVVCFPCHDIARIVSSSVRFNDPIAKPSSVLDEIGRNRNADVDALLWGNAN